MKATLYFLGILLFFQTTNTNDCKIETSMNELTNSLYNSDNSEDSIDLKKILLKDNKLFSQYLNILKKEKIFKKRKYLFFIFLSETGSPYTIAEGNIILNNKYFCETRFGKILNEKYKNQKSELIDNIIKRYESGFKLKTIDSVYIRLKAYENKLREEYARTKLFIDKYNEAYKKGLILKPGNKILYRPRLFAIIEKNEIQKIYFIDNTFYGERLVYDINDSEKYEKICDSINKLK